MTDLWSTREGEGTPSPRSPNPRRSEGMSSGVVRPGVPSGRIAEMREWGHDPFSCGPPMALFDRGYDLPPPGNASRR